jgi:hypothetical protein
VRVVKPTFFYLDQRAGRLVLLLGELVELIRRYTIEVCDVSKSPKLRELFFQAEKALALGSQEDDDLQTFTVRTNSQTANGVS